MDAARTALPSWRRSTYCVQKKRSGLPARVEEVHHAKEEGVILIF